MTMTKSAENWIANVRVNQDWKFPAVLDSCGRGISKLKDWIFSDGSGDKNLSTPTGQRGSPMEVKPGTNEPTSIGGRDYTGHRLDQM